MCDQEVLRVPGAPVCCPRSVDVSEGDARRRVQGPATDRAGPAAPASAGPGPRRAPRTAPGPRRPRRGSGARRPSRRPRPGTCHNTFRHDCGLTRWRGGSYGPGSQPHIALHDPRRESPRTPPGRRRSNVLPRISQAQVPPRSGDSGKSGRQLSCANGANHSTVSPWAVKLSGSDDRAGRPPEAGCRPATAPATPGSLL
jgi:hypothetical protein